MPTFDIVKTSAVPKTYRTEMVRGSFDLNDEKIKEHFKGNIAIENHDWKIGLICGGSGTGKTTIAREVFGDDHFTRYDYGKASVVDEMPEQASVSEITQTFTSVGFASVPSWLKPYYVLSNGEKMRVDLARMLLDSRQLNVVDEFTSVVDRRVAQTASAAMQKAIQRTTDGKQYVFVSCHKDIIEWLQPDWIFDTDEQRFVFTQRQADRQSSLKSAKSSEQIRNRHCGNALAVITI